MLKNQRNSIMSITVGSNDDGGGLRIAFHRKLNKWAARAAIKRLTDGSTGTSKMKLCGVYDDAAERDSMHIQGDGDAEPDGSQPGGGLEPGSGSIMMDRGRATYNLLKNVRAGMHRHTMYAGLRDVATLPWNSAVCLGAGTYGRVRKFQRRKRARSKVAPEYVAVKRFRNSQRPEASFLEELSIAETMNRLRSKYVMHTIDAFTYMGRCFLVMPWCGMSLRHALQTTGRTKPVGWLMCKWLCLGIQAIHAQKILHLDVKPSNILVESTGSELKSLKISDFGLARVYDSEYVSRRDDELFNANSVQYRPLECIIGDDRGFGIDMWAVGLTMYEVATEARLMFNASEEQDVARQILERFGVDDQGYVRRLARWRDTYPTKGRADGGISDHVKAFLGKDLVWVLKGCLQVNVHLRIDADSAAGAVMSVMDDCVSCTEAHSHQETVATAQTDMDRGCTALKSHGPPVIVNATKKGFTVYRNTSNDGVMRGERGTFAFGYGHIGDDVLEYVNLKNGLHELTADQLRDMEMDTFDAPQMARNRSWQCRSAVGDKIQFAGKMCANCTGGQMNTLSMKQYLFTKGWVAWREALFSIGQNIDIMNILRRNLREKMKRTSGDSANKTSVCDLQPCSQIASCGEGHITRAGGTLVEKDHCDGGGGMFVITTTGHGTRTLKMVVAGEPSHIHFMQRPGSVWMGNVTACRHQVIHTPPEAPSQMLTMGDLTMLSTSCVMRSAVFPDSRRGKGVPSPQHHFNAANDTISSWFAKYGQTMVMPSLADVQAAYAKLFGVTHT